MNGLNKIYFLCGWLLLLRGCNERWLSNSSGSRAFRFMDCNENLVGLLVKSMKKGDVIGFVDTGASKYHRYSARWISDDCILFKSSDIGYRAIVVNEKCLLYFAQIESKNGVSRVVLFDEDWEPVGMEFGCLVDESDK